MLVSSRKFLGALALSALTVAAAAPAAAAATSNGSVSVAGDIEAKEIARQEVNIRRSLHSGTNPLMQDITLDASAQAQSDLCDMMSASPAGTGLNLFAAAATLANTPEKVARDAVNVWYSENVNYNYNTGKSYSLGSPILHFTQLVWKGSTKIGVGITKCATVKGMAPSPDGYIMVATHYKDAGNVYGKFVENVGTRQ